MHGCVRDLDDESELEDLVEDDSMSSIASRGPHSSQMMRARRSSSNAANLWASERAVLSRQRSAARCGVGRRADQCLDVTEVADVIRCMYGEGADAVL